MISRKRWKRTMSTRLPPQVELMREPTLKTFSGSSSTFGPTRQPQHLRLLAEGEARRAEAEVLVRPHLAGEADAGLHLVDDEEALVRRARQAGQGLQELGAEVVVAAFGLDGLDEDGGDVVGVVGEGRLDLRRGPVPRPRSPRARPPR